MADARLTGCADPPASVASALAVSDDGGKTWARAMAAQLPEGAATMDGALLYDAETGVVFFQTTVFPENYGGLEAQYGSGFELVDGAPRLVLYDGPGQDGQRGQGNRYYVDDDGLVRSMQGAPTGYSVGDGYELFHDGRTVGSVFSAAAPLKLFGTSYIGLISSADEGTTWSPLRLISSFKAPWMRFLGNGPGRGIQQRHGPHRGRLVATVFFMNQHDFYSNALLFSDDHGATWTLSASPNDHRDGSPDTAETLSAGNQLSESQVVEMPDGQLKLFARNSGGDALNEVKVATMGTDDRWLPHVDSYPELYEPDC